MGNDITGYPFPAELVARITARRGRLHCYDRLDPRRTALVVVDMQTAFLKEGWPTALDPARDVVPAINRLADSVRRTGGKIIWVVSTYGPDEADRWQVLFDHVMGPETGGHFRDVLTEGHEGHAIWPLLDFRPGEAIVSKNRFSGFCGSKGRLERLLRDNGLDTLLIAGTVTNVCCESTAREAAFLDFKTIMVSDANAARTDLDNLVTYSTFIRAFGDVMSSAEAIARLDEGAARIPEGLAAKGA
ncbi:MAG TPA: isochorismatase family cysteine hydrolase [Alphaproteobacteria bacterium]|nr:isochorismatase family cysteine hydrolase [Alphaproteobacteria bacterium]